MITLLQKVFYFQSLCFQVVTMRVSDQCWWSVFTSEWWQSSVITHILGTLLDTLLDILHPPSPFTLLQQAISIKRSNIAHKWWICSKIQSQSIKISLGLRLNSESLTLFNLCFEHILIPCFLFFLDASDISKKNLYVSELLWKTFHWRIYITLLDLLFLSVIVCWMIWDYWRKLTFISVFCSVYNLHIQYSWNVIKQAKYPED